MAFLLFGTSTKAATAERGSFFCPQCESQQAYELKVVKQYGTLYFIPAVSLGEKGSYVECMRCGGTFQPLVLEYDPEAASREFQAEFQKGILRVAIQMMLADGVIAEAEISTIQEIYRQLSKGEISESEIRRLAGSFEASSERELFEFLSTLALALNDNGKEQVVGSAYWVAGSDGRLDDEEEAFLFRVGKTLGMSKAHVKAVMDEMTVRRG